MRATRHWAFAERFGVLVVLLSLIIATLSLYSEVAELADWSESKTNALQAAFTVMGWLVYYLVFCAVADAIERTCEAVNQDPNLPTLVIYLTGAAFLVQQAITSEHIAALGSPIALGSAVPLMLLIKGSVPYIATLFEGRIPRMGDTA